MRPTEEVIGQVRQAFGANAYPGDQFLQGSFEGCEPSDEIGAFVGKTDWTQLDAAMLDGHYCALSFFSEAGFRYFLPAYLTADLLGKLKTADPLFHLCHGFSSFSTNVPVLSQTFQRSSGGDTLLNPRCYGAMTWCDHARQRLSVFTREEAAAIVSYMKYKREHDASGLDRPRIDAALERFWLERAASAPSRRSLEEHLSKEDEFTAALQQRMGDKK